MEALLENIQENNLGIQYKKLNGRLKKLHREEAINLIPLLKDNENIHKYIKFYIIDRFQLSEQLIELLKSEDKQYIVKALKCKWFFTGEHKEIGNIDFFETNLFPFISYLTKIQIINNLSKYFQDKTQLEDLFNNINKKYGFKLASRILPGCRNEFIKSIIKVLKCRIPAYILFKIAKKDCNLAIYYLELLTENQIKNYGGINIENHITTLNYIACKNTQLWLDFFIKSQYDNNFELNSKISKTILLSNPSIIIANANLFFARIDPKYIIKYLNDNDLFEFINKFLPEKLRKFDLIFLHMGRHCSVSFRSFLQLIPTEKQYPFMKRIFKERYGVDLLSAIQNNINIDNDKVLLTMPEEERIKIAEYLIVKKPQKEFDLLKHFPLDKSIPEIKKRLKTAFNENARSTLISSLVATCFINKSLDHFTQVLEFIEQTYRTEFRDVQCSVLNQIESLADYDKLNLNHWEMIFQFIKLFQIEDDFASPYLYHPILTKYVEFRYKHNLSLDELVLNMIKYMIRPLNSFNWPDFGKNINLQYIFYHKFLQHLNQNNNLDYWYESTVTDFLDVIKELNKKSHKKIILSESPWLLQIYYSCLEENLNWILLDCMNYNDLDGEEKKILNEKLLIKQPIQRTLIYFLHRKPERIVENLNQIFEYILTKKIIKYIKFFRSIKAIEFLNIKNLIQEKCSKILSLEDSDNNKIIKAIRIICLLSDNLKMNNIFEKYYPSESGDENVDLYDIRKALIKTLFRIQPLISFAVLKKFLVNDYIYVSHRSFDSICLNSVENKVKPFLNETLNSRVSLKKHAIKLLFIINTKIENYKQLTQLIKKEENPSIRKIIFDLVFNNFIRNPTDENYSFFLVVFEQINETDFENIENLFELFHITKSTLSDYCPKIWTLLNNKFINENPGKIDQAKIDFLTNISEISYLKHLDYGFIQKVIFENLENEKLFTVVLSTLVNFLLICPNEIIVNDTIEKIMKFFKTSISKDLQKESFIEQFENKKLFLKFIENICTKISNLIIYNQVYNHNAIISLYSTLVKGENSDSFFQEQFYFELLNIYSEEKDILSFGRKSKIIINRYIEKYSDNILMVLLKMIKTFLIWIGRKYYDENQEKNAKILYCSGLLDENDSAIFGILAIRILPREINKNNDYYDKYKSIINTLKASPEMHIFSEYILLNFPIK